MIDFRRSASEPEAVVHERLIYLFRSYNVQMFSPASAAAMMSPGDVASRIGPNILLAINYTAGSGILRKTISNQILWGNIDENEANSGISVSRVRINVQRLGKRTRQYT